ncbi:MAG: raiA [Armatimonadetes bacterium]|jgi:putative sigma-54 modulation protein|nr:raiA [Armatimonadota bacterium]
MQVTFTGKQVQITDREREYAERKLSRLSRYFSSARVAHVMHSVQRNWQIVEVQLDLNGTLVRAEERTPDFFASVDAVTDKLEQQVRKLKGRIKNRKGRADAPMVASLLAEMGEEAAAAEEPTPAVVRRKQIAIKPMTADEAALQMDLLNHDFFAFLNADTEQVGVLYRRKDGDYGLLELEAA